MTTSIRFCVLQRTEHCVSDQAGSHPDVGEQSLVPSPRRAGVRVSCASFFPSPPAVTAARRPVSTAELREPVGIRGTLTVWGVLSDSEARLAKWFKTNPGLKAGPVPASQRPGAWFRRGRDYVYYCYHFVSPRLGWSPAFRESALSSCARGRTVRRMQRYRTANGPPRKRLSRARREAGSCVWGIKHTFHSSKIQCDYLRFI